VLDLGSTWPWLPYLQERGIHFTGGWVDPIAGLDTCGEEKMSCLHWVRTPNFPVCSRFLYWLCCPGPRQNKTVKNIKFCVSIITYLMCLYALVGCSCFLALFFIWVSSAFCMYIFETWICFRNLSLQIK